MDDILILGTSAKDLHKGVKEIIKFAKDELGVDIKSDWVIYKMPFVKNKYHDKIFIDMMGARIYRKHLSIRDYVFVRIRRAYLRAARRIKDGLVIPISCARRIISYNGIVNGVSSYKFRRKYATTKIFKLCKSVVKDYDKRKSKIRKQTVFCYSS